MEAVTHWLDGHLPGCPAKALTGMDCPGCGLQRSFVALLRGDLEGAWELYPPLLPLLALLVLLPFAIRGRWRYRFHALATAGAATFLFVAVNFAFKLAA
jgi:hypothetical protein